MQILSVCVLPGKNNTYGEKLMFYRYSLVKRQPLERTYNMSSKKTMQPIFDCMLKLFYIIITLSVGLKHSEIKKI